MPTRREFLADAAAASAWLGASLIAPPGLLAAAKASTPDVAVASNGKIHTMVRKAVEMLGGMGAFVSKGDIVVVKPNIGWDRAPKYAADTNPWVVSEIVKMCLEAGAKKVKVFDRPCDTPARCYKSSGIEEAATKAGAEVSHTVSSGFVSMKFPGGQALKSWPMYKPAIEADVLINVPIAKHHGTTGLSLGMKNLMGIMGKNRGTIHLNIHRKLADTGAFVKPALTIIDAVRILKDNGPQGGDLDDVLWKGTVIAGTRLATVDAYAVTLFGQEPADQKFLVYGKEAGLGEIDLQKVWIKKVSLG
jgi:uncharacterized protein (DUF362 family)